MNDFSVDKVRRENPTKLDHLKEFLQILFIFRIGWMEAPFFVSSCGHAKNLNVFQK